MMAAPERCSHQLFRLQVFDVEAPLSPGVIEALVRMPSLPHTQVLKTLTL